MYNFQGSPDAEVAVVLLKSEPHPTSIDAGTFEDAKQLIWEAVIWCGNIGKFPDGSKIIWDARRKTFKVI